MKTLDRHLAEQEFDQVMHERYEEYLKEHFPKLSTEIAEQLLFGRAPRGETEAAAVTSLTGHLTDWMDEVVYLDWGRIVLSDLMENYQVGQTYERFCEPPDPPNTP